MMEISKKCFFKLLMMDLLLFLLYWYYQPLCEPCVGINDCPPCISKEQFYIIYLGTTLNLLLGIYCIAKSKFKRSKSEPSSGSSRNNSKG